MKKIYTIFTLSLLSLCGCIRNPNNTINNENNSSTKSNLLNKVALICNLTKVDPKAYDGWDGDCPGTDVDANIMVSMCKLYGIPYVKLENEKCTSKNVIKEWNKCVSQLNPTNGLFIFFYSGHGGQVYTTDTSEKDGLDETLCFWDGQFIDDNVWKLINTVPKTARCFMLTDCCNSGSNYRLPFNLKKSRSKLSTRGVEPNLLHIGGCNDGEYSYGSNRGGVLTGVMKSTFNKNITYIEWFNKTKSAMKNSKQVPTFAETGKSFKNTKIFE